MRKLVILLLLQLFGCPVFAENTLIQPKQEFKDNKALLAVQKQPSMENQKQSVKNNWFCVVVQVNGKIDSLNRTIADTKQ